MTTVAQMIEWMKTLPQDTVVVCGIERTKSYETWMEFVPVDISACDLYDYTSEEDRVKYPDMVSRRIVMIRGE